MTEDEGVAESELSSLLQSSSTSVTLDSVLPSFGVLDWEEGGWLFATSSGQFRIERQELLSGDLLAVHRDITVLVVESAHMQPRVGSPAQVYYEDEHVTLKDVISNYGVHIRLFPERKTTRALNTEFGALRNKNAEARRQRERKALAAEAIRRLLLRDPSIFRSLKRWHPLTDRERFVHAWCDDVRYDAHQRINLIRDNSLSTSQRRLEFDMRHCAEVIAAASAQMTVEEKWVLHDFFEVKRLRSGPDRGKLVFNHGAVMAVYTVLFDRKGRLRKGVDGGPISRSAAWKIIGLYANGYPSLMRSNLLHHRLPSLVKSRGITSETRAFDKEFDAPEIEGRRESYQQVFEDRKPIKRELRRAVKLLIRVLHQQGLEDATRRTSSRDELASLASSAQNTEDGTNVSSSEDGLSALSSSNGSVSGTRYTSSRGDELGSLLLADDVRSIPDESMEDVR